MRSFWAIAAFAIAIGCSSSRDASTSSAIVGGDVDTTTSGVVMVYIHAKVANGGWADCSGTVISPHVVLTAAHCLDPALVGLGTDAVTQIYVGNDIYATPTAGDFYATTTTVIDPKFSAPTIATNGHDVGVVVTTNALPIAPMAFARAPLDSSIVGQAARLVGYGETDPADASSDGTRHSGTTTIAALDPVDVMTANQLPSGCEGDSGGPLFVTMNGQETVVGVISHGNALQDCKGASTAERVDLEDAFVEPIIDQYDPGFLPSDATDAAADVVDENVSTAPPASSGGCATSPSRARFDTSWFLFALVTVARKRGARSRANSLGRGARCTRACRLHDDAD